MGLQVASWDLRPLKAAAKFLKSSWDWGRDTGGPRTENSGWEVTQLHNYRLARGRQALG